MKFEQPNSESANQAREARLAAGIPPGNVLERAYADALVGESYENTAAAVTAVEEVQDFRKRLKGMPFASFCDVFETLTEIDRTPFPAVKKQAEIMSVLDVMEDKASRFSPRVADLYSGVIAALRGVPYEPRFPMTADKLSELVRAGDLDVLSSGNHSWEMKVNRIEMRLSDYLSGARALDRREGGEMDDDIRVWREEQLAQAPTRPPARNNESKPGVDPMERLKGNERAPSIWSITPAWGGYYKEQSFSKWDSRRNVWVEDEYSYREAHTIPLSENKDPRKGPIDITMNASVLPGQWVSLPVPYTHELHKIEAGGRRSEVKQDQNGDLVILVEGNDAQPVAVSIFLAANPDKRFTSEDRREIKVPEMPSEFSDETNKVLENITKTRQGNIARGRAINTYVKQRIQYLAPYDRAEADYYNNAYNTSPKGFAGAVDELKKADCDVANTYFAALCARLNIPVRHCVGHSVKGKDERGSANINSGTGHGWSEIWDDAEKDWIRIDATSAGDPNLEEEQQDERRGSAVPGDYGDAGLAVRPTDEQLEALRKKLEERKEELSYTKEERNLAVTTGIEPKEARQIVREINEAERLRLPNGELITDALAGIFNAIVESRKTVAPAYDGPVRRSEGGEHIEDIVRHKIGTLAGDTDPMSREKPAEETQEEKIIGGFDLYVIGDKSGSTKSEVEVTGGDTEAIWKMQRRAEYLIFSSLDRFARNLDRAGLQKENALSIRTQGISFRGDDPREDIDLDKELGSSFTSQDKVRLWHSLTNIGMGNGDVTALSYVHEQIKKEIVETEKRGGKDNRLRLVIACSDGGYVGTENKMRLVAEDLHRLRAVVVGMGLTETAASVPIVMENPPYSRGDIARDVNDLPALVAKHVVLEAVKLFPEKSRESAARIIEAAIAKFKKAR
jgi:transglutaminase-like putative cysteine protease